MSKVLIIPGQKREGKIGDGREEKLENLLNGYYNFVLQR